MLEERACSALLPVLVFSETPSVVAPCDLVSSSCVSAHQEGADTTGGRRRRRFRRFIFLSDVFANSEGPVGANLMPCAVARVHGACVLGTWSPAHR